MAAFTGVDTSRLLVEGMKVAEENHRLIANNLANLDTPGYNPVRLDFQATLKAAVEGRGRVALRTTQARHLDAGHVLHRYEDLAIQSKNDYNKVDVDEEMAKLSENTGRYTTYGSLLAKRFEIVKRMLSDLRQ